MLIPEIDILVETAIADLQQMPIMRDKFRFVIDKVEASLVEEAIRVIGSEQKAAIWLGISRNKLRKCRKDKGTRHG